MKVVDINCDVGEGIANEKALMPFISSCNIACTGHAGTIETIDKTIKLAILNNVKIGAHPSFPDKVNFGRKLIKMPHEALQQSIESQINLLAERIVLQNASLYHVKAHGALYNASAVDESIATTLVRAVKNTDKNAFLYVPYNSVIERVAKANTINTKYEAFIDRNYNDDLTLVSRKQDHALIVSAEEAFNHLFKMIDKAKVTTISNKEATIKADTFCIHGDNENAIAILEHIAEQLKNKGVKIA